MTEEHMKAMVDRFLAWRLPDDFSPDGGISFTKAFNERTAFPMKHEPVGTNLFTATQATAMVRHMVEGLSMSGPPQHDVATIDDLREMEECVLRLLDKLKDDADTKPDQRWLSIGRTAIEQGFMAVTRSVLKPERLAIPELDGSIVETGWVIELDDPEKSPVSSPFYYAPAFGLDPWSRKHSDALRFARVEDAAILANCLVVGALGVSVRICEHQWG